MNFEQALFGLKQGQKLTRSGWNGKDMYIEAQIPDEHSKMSRPYVFIKTAQGDLVPWAVSYGDLFGDDWSLYQVKDQAQVA